MKLYKGDVIKFKDAPDYFIGRVTGKKINQSSFIVDEVIVISACPGNRYSFGPKIDEKAAVDIYNYANTLFDGHINKEYVKIVKPGWFRRQRRPFLKRLKYLVLNRF